MASAAARSTAGKGPTRLPAAIANATLEELQKMFVDTLVKMRKKDRRIEELTAAATAATAPGSIHSDGDASEPAVTAALRQQVSQCPPWAALLRSSEHAMTSGSHLISAAAVVIRYQMIRSSILESRHGLMSGAWR